MSKLAAVWPTLNLFHIYIYIYSGNSLTRSSWGLAFYYLLSELRVIQQIYYVMNVIGTWQNATCYQEFLVNRVRVNELLIYIYIYIYSFYYFDVSTIVNCQLFGFGLPYLTSWLIFIFKIQ